MKRCLKCGHENQATVSDPLAECPKCGAIYSRVEASLKAKTSESEPLPTPRTAPRMNKLNIRLIAAAIVIFAIGYFAGREHIKYELKSAFQNAAAGISAAFKPSQESPAIAKPKPIGRNQAQEDNSPTLKEIVSVSMGRKWYAKQDYQDYVFFDLSFTGVGLDKPAKAIKGTLNITDLFGEPKMKINWTLDQSMVPGETISENGNGFKYNQFIDSHQWVRMTDLSSMSATFTVHSILYEDGTRRDYE